LKEARPVNETKRQLKDRLVREGKWPDFLAIRDRLVREGMPPAEAREEALRQVEAMPPRQPDLPPVEQPVEVVPLAVAGAQVAEVVADGPVDILAEMEAILSRPKADDRTDLQKKLRRQYDQTFDEFMNRLVKLRGKPGPKPEAPAALPPPPEAEDDGELALGELLDRTIRRINGTCPLCGRKGPES
jgi:hypothetical protein